MQWVNQASKCKNYTPKRKQKQIVKKLLKKTIQSIRVFILLLR